MNPIVLVTDGENRSSLAVTRSLGCMGCRVIVTGNNCHNISSQSKYCSAKYCITSASTHDRKCINEMVDVIKIEEVDFIFPMTETTIYSLIKFQKKIPTNVTWSAIHSDQISQIFDKYNLFKLASKLYIDIPKTIFIGHPDELPDKIVKIKEYPVVVKPGMSKIASDTGYLATGVKYARSKNELEALYKNEKGLAYPSLIQEKITGEGTGLFTLFDCDHPLALFSHKRIREKPPSGGVSVVCESIPLDQGMVDATQKLLSAVDWHGVAMVEFKRDDNDGKVKLIEINGRFWGSLQLAISAGVDFPQLLLRYLQGDNEFYSDFKYREGIQLKWLLGTLDHMLIRLKNNDEDLHLPPGTPSKWRSVIDFLGIAGKATVYDVFNLKDMRPFFQELKEYSKHITGR
ncbi:ATP-grasp domain-containing protein [Desulfobacterales bacterium HSG17]|nr:ATP-grasp domain-containing protein [Desulfobacterales bacterium HSG17]